ncbi:hypothetical protein [Mycolicibacterium hippocampi]|nr:hypothetical protein [Mycolicibacterium hippocampi]
MSRVAASAAAGSAAGSPDHPGPTSACTRRIGVDNAVISALGITSPR